MANAKPDAAANDELPRRAHMQNPIRVGTCDNDDWT